MVEQKLRPAPHIVFVQAVDPETKNAFEVTGSQEYKVTNTGNEVEICKPGDLVLFTDSQEFTFRGNKFLKVNDSDIIGVHDA